FFEEASENIEQLEQKLLALDVKTNDDEELNAIFRCAHSIKGGAATFGFQDVAELTHEMETLLDKLRRHELTPTPVMIDVLLAANDSLKLLMARHQGDGSEPPSTHELVERIRDLANGTAQPAEPATAAAPAADVAPPAAAVVEPPAPVAAAPADAPAPPPAAPATPVVAQAAPESIKVQAAPEPATTKAPAGRDAGFGFFDGAPGAPPPSATPPAAPQVHAAERAPADSTTLRVPVEKVDQLINLVGELVITQAVLEQNGEGLDRVLHQRMAAGLAELERNTRALQEAVMSIRMIPMSMVFNRFPRMLRDLAQKLGKSVELATQGEATELDKG
ncbi:MAG: chemotaxis protein CheA, partial [Burkholderiales bacterium 12-64-5]